MVRVRYAPMQPMPISAMLTASTLRAPYRSASRPARGNPSPYTARLALETRLTSARVAPKALSRAVT